MALHVPVFLLFVMCQARNQTQKFRIKFFLRFLHWQSKNQKVQFFFLFFFCSQSRIWIPNLPEFRSLIFNLDLSILFILWWFCAFISAIIVKQKLAQIILTESNSCKTRPFKPNVNFTLSKRAVPFYEPQRRFASCPRAEKMKLHFGVDTSLPKIQIQNNWHT